jgi:NADH-quinone oxidoreductase subunit G
MGAIDQVPSNDWAPLAVKEPTKADLRNAIKDYYLTNPIARASVLMGELQKGVAARGQAPMAAE